ncbi:M23 family metallopeptidase [Oculatella sp. LEGE 06141]|uniref:M23 family metallopeptidase n=1 Tax=Oculatella sp. LEGE 06141 TaxID=1828648 RepID=UPI00187FE7FC|nr:M23 family metallopeptidase [Oculatella sp. LEGE 06141]MBE9178713.1 M23 family metallopeptidase [Oculatella sp. LEGE 06141]
MTTAAPPRTLDLIERIAAHDGHIIGASMTGSGKTTTMLAAIAAIDHLTNGQAVWLCGSGKASFWMGLEDQIGEDGLSRVLTASTSKPESIEPLLARLRFAIALQEKREQQRLDKSRRGKTVNPKPIYVVLDEWLILLKVAKRHSKEAYQELIDLVETIALKGRQDRVFIWLWAQGHHCKTLHLDGDLRNNFGVIALGGAGNNSSVESAIADADLIPNRFQREQLEVTYKELFAEDPTGRVFYTSLGGHVLGRTMQLPDMEAQRIFEASRSRFGFKAKPPSKTKQANELASDSYDSGEAEETPEWVRLRQAELRLKTREYLDKSLTAEQRWNLITLTVGVVVSTVYLVPPFSGALQAAWDVGAQAAGIAGQAVDTAGSVINYFAPDLKATPKVGEIIAGYRVTSPFGKRDRPCPTCSEEHKGVDLGTPTGTQLYAVGEPGKTVEVKCWWDGNGGGNVATYDSMGSTWQYLHLSRCAAGTQRVGSIIAQSGSSGIGTGAHFHIEQIQNGEKLPPPKWAIWASLTGKLPEPAIARSN